MGFFFCSEKIKSKSFYGDGRIEYPPKIIEKKSILNTYFAVASVQKKNPILNLNRSLLYLKSKSNRNNVRGLAKNIKTPTKNV